MMSAWNPEDYHRHSSQQQKWAQDILARLSLREHERVLDIGCGDGKVTAEIARLAPRGFVLGLDAATEMIEFARRNFPPEDFPNLRFEIGDAKSLRFENEFDCVVSFACLHWVIDHRPVLAGIRRALVPGGKILLQFGGKGNAARVVEAVSNVTTRPKWAPYFSGFQFPWGFYGPDEYRPWLEEAGFTATRVVLVPKDMVHPGREGLEGWFRTTWMPYVQRLPEALQQDFLIESVDEYLRENPADRDGLVHLAMTRLEVEAIKPR